MTPRSRSRGFTLIEVLIGATVLAIMMTLLTSALFTMTRSAHAGETRMTELDSEQLVYAFLRRQLQSAFPLTERRNDEELALFEGRADRLRFVGHLPLAEGGGLHFIEVMAADGELSLRYRDAAPEAPFERVDGAWTSRSLLSDVDRIRWRYYGAADDEARAGWSDEWRGHGRLPELIRAEIEHDDESVTALVAEVRVRTAAGQAGLYRDRLENRR